MRARRPASLSYRSVLRSHPYCAHIQQALVRRDTVPNAVNRPSRIDLPHVLLLLLLLQVAVSGSLGTPLQLQLTDVEGHTAGETKWALPHGTGNELGCGAIPLVMLG